MCHTICTTATFRGIGVSPGIARGIVAYLPEAQPHSPSTRTIAPTQIPVELQRLELACDKGLEELDMLLEIAQSHDLGQATLDVLRVHQMLLQDGSLRRGIQQRICNQLLTASMAISEAIDSIVRLYAAKGPLLESRTSDFRDLERRLLDHLDGRPEMLDISRIAAGSILVAEDLLPSQLVALAPLRLGALITEGGSPTSHATIIARSWGIPAIVGTVGITAALEAGANLHVDGCSGEIHVLDEAGSQPARRVVSVQDEAPPVADAAGGLLPDVVLLGNVNRAEDLPDIRGQGLQGVGLYRTELFYLHSLMPPSQVQQKQDYRHACALVDPHETIIRTFDFSPEKRPVFWGSRSAHVVEGEQQFLILEQLEALLRCYRSAGNLAIMLPMIRNANHLQRHLDAIDRIAERLKLDSLPLIGAMVETLDAVRDLPAIAERVDFLSIGSNDLASDLLGVERTGDTLRDSRQWMMNPLLLRTVARIVDVARQAKCPLSLCGEVAGDPILAVLYVGLGLRRLSFGPLRTAQVRHALSQVTMEQAQRVAEATRDAETISGVISALVYELPPEILHIVSQHRWAWATNGERCAETRADTQRMLRHHGS